MSVMWSGVRKTYRVRFADRAEVDVTVGIPDAMRWEANNSGKSLLSSMGLTTMLTVIWYAMRRQGLSDQTDLGAFVASVEDFGQVEEEAAGPGGGMLPDPSRTDQSDG